MIASGLKRNRRKLYPLLAPAIVIAAVAVVVAGSIDAVVELGQPNFTTSGYLSTVTQTGLALPYGVAIDRAGGHLYVADTADNRVLGWASISALTNGASADLVIGQTNFTSDLSGTGASGLNEPWSVAVSSKGDLYVSDYGNNRVLEYNSPYSAFGHTCSPTNPCVGGLAANLVLGQGTAGNNFSTNAACTAATDTYCLSEPGGLAIDANDNLYVADILNDRALIFLNPLATSSGCSTPGCAGDVIADYSLGECTANNGFLDSRADCTHPTVTMLGPNAVAVDSAGNTYVADTQNNRVLEFNNPVGTGNLAADRAYGAGSSGSNFTPAVCSNGFGPDPDPSATAICNPAGLALDSANDLYVSDYGNSRVLEFASPLTNFIANLVIGQDSAGSDFTAGVCYGGQPGSGSDTSASATGLCSPAGLATDASNNLFVADTDNSRVIEFSDPAASPSGTSSSTSTASPSARPTATATGATATATATSTTGATKSPTATATSSPSVSPTKTTTATPTATATAATATPTVTPTATVATATMTATPSPTPTSVAAKLTVSPKTLNFGKVDLNGSKTKALTIKNDSKGKNGVTVQVESESSSNPAFSVSQQCSEALAPGKSCVVKIAFSPGTDTAKQLGDLTISTDVQNAPAAVKMEGSGKKGK
jgi:hypothetical protein